MGDWQMDSSNILLIILVIAVVVIVIIVVIVITCNSGNGGGTSSSNDPNTNQNNDNEDDDNNTFDGPTKSSSAQTSGNLQNSSFVGNSKQLSPTRSQITIVPDSTQIIPSMTTGSIVIQTDHVQIIPSASRNSPTKYVNNVPSGSRSASPTKRVQIVPPASNSGGQIQIIPPANGSIGNVQVIPSVQHNYQQEGGVIMMDGAFDFSDNQNNSGHNSSEILDINELADQQEIASVEDVIDGSEHLVLLGEENLANSPEEIITDVILGEVASSKSINNSDKEIVINDLTNNKISSVLSDNINSDAFSSSGLHKNNLALIPVSPALHFTAKPGVARAGGLRLVAPTTTKIVPTSAKINNNRYNETSGMSVSQSVGDPASFSSNFSSQTEYSERDTDNKDNGKNMRSGPLL